MKKIFSLLVVNILMLSGCGSSTDTLTVWAMGEEGNSLGEFSTGFTEETGIDVEVVAIPWDQANEKLTTAIASGTGPDVVQMGNTWISQFAEAGALADLSDYSANYENFNLDLYFDGASESAMYNGTQYSVPWYVDTRLLYYRTDIVEETCGTVPTTQDELYSCSVKLSERGEGQYGLDLDVNDQSLIPMFAWGNGWEFQDEAGNWNFTDEEFSNSLELLSDFGTSGATNYDSGIDIMNSFFDGSVPMFFSGPWMVNIMTDAQPEMTDKWSIALMPSGSSSNSTIMGGTNWVIMESSEMKDQSAEYINWMMENEQQAEWYNTVGSLPARTETWDEEQFTSDPYLPIWKEQLEVAKSVPSNQNYEAIAQEMVSEQQEVTLAQKDGSEAATTVQEYAESLEE